MKHDPLATALYEYVALRTAHEARAHFPEAVRAYHEPALAEAEAVLLLQLGLRFRPWTASCDTTG